VYLIFWKCEGFKVSGVGLENGMEVEVEVTPPTEEQLDGLGLNQAAAELKPLRSKFRVGFDFRVVPGSLKGEIKAPFIIFTLQKFAMSGVSIVL